jgi:DUF971 family protein
MPRAITRTDPSKVVIEWNDGTSTVYTAAQLRTICPCAKCVDELTGIRTLDPNSIPASLTQSNLTLVGNYALSVVYSDGHNTGIYPWNMLRERDPAAGDVSS